jgi:hypothetical protein
MIPKVDLILLSRSAGPLNPAVEQGLRNQRGIQLVVHRVVGQPQSSDRCRYETIARARNEGKSCGREPWLLFVDDDVVLESQCISTLVNELRRRPMFAALAADYLGERREREIARHVSMGATLFRRAAVAQISFRWRENRCECQCCCDDVRRLGWAIDYCPAAKARHLPKREVSEHSPADAAADDKPQPITVDKSEQYPPGRIPSVCLVLCYFGPLPGWANQYLLSCAYNPSIDFLILTDQKHFPSVPLNVRVVQFSISDFNKLATSKIGVDIRLSHPRKVCDFKPAYGHLFEEFLDGWDYWGYTDFDVIYGDIRRFLSTARLQNFDIFTARKEFLVGHFTLFRNNPGMKRLYQQSANLPATLTSPDVLSFDECGRQWRRRLQGKPLSRAATCDSMTHIVHRKLANKKLSVCFAPVAVEWTELNSRDWRLRWQAGRLWRIDQRREAMYFHFHAFKHSRGYREPRALGGDTILEMSSQGIERASVQ